MNKLISRLQRWLAGSGALAPDLALLGPSEGSLRLETQAGARPAASVGGFAAWRLRRREWLNPGSADAPVWRLTFEVPAGQRWEAGDLVEIQPPQAGVRPRRYSIASLAEDGGLELLVRLRIHPDGTPGACSGWLCVQLNEGVGVPLRVCRNSAFHLPADDRPLLLIGNGTGVAGLRSLLRERFRRGQPRNWLIFGGRTSEHDFLCGDDLLGWQAEGHLQRLDLAFSRDQASKIHVQDRLRAAADELLAWLADGATIYVCGSRQGVGADVDRLLRELLGSSAVAELQDSGRYRRDLY